jgi:hypothetical protein
MIDDTTKVAFVREGLKHYPGARETVDYFQTTILEGIQNAFEEKTDWKHFEPRRQDGNLEYGKAVGSIDRYIQSWARGTIQTQGGINAWLAISLIWNPMRRPNSPVLVVANAWTDKGVVLALLDSPGRNPRVMLGPVSRRNERRLFLEPGDDFDPYEAFALVLDAADDALGPFSAPSDVARKQE